MCPRRFVFARYPIVLRYSPGRPDKCESIWAIGCPLPLRPNHAPDRKRLRDRVNANRCKCCLWRIAGRPSNADILKRRWASLFATPNAQSLGVRPGSAASEARETIISAAKPQPGKLPLLSREVRRPIQMSARADHRDRKIEPPARDARGRQVHFV